jgi:hypothetical protein
MDPQIEGLVITFADRLPGRPNQWGGHRWQHPILLARAIPSVRVLRGLGVAKMAILVRTFLTGHQIKLKIVPLY